GRRDASTDAAATPMRRTGGKLDDRTDCHNREEKLVPLWRREAATPEQVVRPRSRSRPPTAPETRSPSPNGTPPTSLRARVAGSWDLQAYRSPRPGGSRRQKPQWH